MASGGGKLLHKLQDEFCECQICFTEYDEEHHVPRVLPCLHTFCSICLLQHCKPTHITCPYCKKLHKVKNKDVQAFPKDNTRRNLKTILDKFARGSCGSCKQLDLVEYYCHKCGFHLCRQCFEIQKLTACKDHLMEVLVESSSAKCTSPERLLTLEKHICTLKGHENNELKFYCNSKKCCKPICANCTTKEHRNHEWEELIFVYERRRESFSTVLETTKQRLQNVRRTIDKIDSEKMALQESDRTGKQNLDKELQRLFVFLEKQKEIMLKRNTDILKDKIGNLDKRRITLQTYLENAQECCYISDKMLAEKDKISFLSMEKTLTDKLKCFIDTILDEHVEKIDTSELELKEPVAKLKEKVDDFTRERNIQYTCKTFGEGAYQNRNDCRNGNKNCIWKVLFVFAVIILLRKVYTTLKLPFCSVYECDDSVTTFGYSNKNITTCISKNRSMISTVPLENTDQKCGYYDSLYVYNGIFLNNSLNFKNHDFLDIHFSVADINSFLQESLLFQFGLSDGSINSKNIKPEDASFYGWIGMLTPDKTSIEIYNTDDNQIMSISLSSILTLEYRYRLHFEGHNNIILTYLDNLSDKIDVIDKHTFPTKETKYLFIRFFDPETAHVRASCLGVNMGFDQLSAARNIFFARDNRIVSNRNITITNQSNTETVNHVQDILINNCSSSCVAYFRLKFDNRETNAVFELQFANIGLKSKKLSFLSLVSDRHCASLSSFFFERTQRKCLRTNPTFSGFHYSQPVSDDWMYYILNVSTYSRTLSFKNGFQEFKSKIPANMNGDKPRIRIKIFTTAMFTIEILNKEKYLLLHYVQDIITDFYNGPFILWLQCISLPIIIVCAMYTFVQNNDGQRGDWISLRRRYRSR